MIGNFTNFQEITKLREQTEKQKRAMKKLEEKLDLVSGKKENMPLSVLSNGKFLLNLNFPL